MFTRVATKANARVGVIGLGAGTMAAYCQPGQYFRCLLYTSDAADDLLCVDLGGRRILKQKKKHTQQHITTMST